MRKPGWPRAQRIARRRAGAATWVARAARPLVCEHCGEYDPQWAAITSIAEKFGMTAETLLGWVRRAEVDDGSRSGATTVEAQRIKDLERENRELRRANEILKAELVVDEPDGGRHRVVGRLQPPLLRHGRLRDIEFGLRELEPRQ